MVQNGSNDIEQMSLELADKEAKKTDYEDNKEADEDSLTHLKIFSYILVCFIHITAQYVLESPAGLEDTIIKVMKVNTAQYDLLFSVYGWPNIVLCLVGGVIVDRFLGLRVGYIFFLTLLTTGQLVIALGAFSNQFWLMLVGRFFCGCGGEMVKVMHRTFAAAWLKKYVIIAFAVQICFGRSGGTLALAASQPLYEGYRFIKTPLYRLAAVFLTGFVFTLVCLILATIVVTLMKTSKKAETDLKSLLHDLKDFSFSFWLMFGIYFTYFPIIFSFSSIGQVYFIDKFGLSIHFASMANAIVFGGVILLVPFLGIVINFIGFLLNWVMASYKLLLLSHISYILSLYWMSYIPFISSFVASISYGIAGVVFYSIPSHLIQKHQLTTAYSLLVLANNIGLSLLTVIIGILVDQGGYLMVEIFMVSVLCIGVALTFHLMLINPNINVSGYQRRKENK